MPPQTASSQLLLPTENTLCDLFERLQARIPTVEELLEFQIALDLECSRHLRSANSDCIISSGTLIAINLYLSGPLLQWRGSDSGRYLEIQLRAVVGALATLHHSGVTGLTGDVHDQLRINIASRFNEILDGRRNSQLSLGDRKSKADALYLIRLAAQYFSLIRRAQPISDAVSIPIVGLVLAGASIAGGQYSSLHSAFRYADHVIGLIPGRRSRHLNLPAVQELTRNASVCFQCLGTDEDRSEDAEQAIADATLVHQLLRDHIEEMPSRKVDAWDWPLARLRRGPPLLNKWYFFYGLLDCVGQLAPYYSVVQFPADLLERLRHLEKDTEWEEFRWKIEEILGDYQSTSRADLSDLPHRNAPDHGPPGEQYIEDDLDPWVQDGDPQVGQLLPPRGLFNKGYTHAGLSIDCRLAFFYNSTKICVYRAMAEGQARRQGDLVFERKFQRSSPIAEVALSEAVLAVSTRQTLELYAIGSHGSNPRPLEIIQHGDWDPSGIAIQDQFASEVMVAIGHRRGIEHTREGRIVLHLVVLSQGTPTWSKIISSSTLSMQDIPKSLSFNGERLISITDVSNTVLVWTSEGEGLPKNEPIKVERYKHRPVSRTLHRAEQVLLVAELTDGPGNR
ncbi:MAG: hypothetical protein Q9218_006856 [Villophora microphyllina]